MIQCELSSEPGSTPGVTASTGPARISYDEQRFFAVGPSARQRLRARLGLRGNVVLAIGAGLVATESLIAAFAEVVRRDPTARLHLAVLPPAGDRVALRAWHTLARRSQRPALLRGRIRFVPSPAEAERADFCRAADVYACPGADQASEQRALEAMACGAPAVLPANGELQRTFAFGRHALHAEPDDPIDFGLTIAKVLRHPRLRHRLGRMGAHQARSLFTRTGFAHRPDVFFLPGFSPDKVRAIA